VQVIGVPALEISDFVLISALTYFAFINSSGGCAPFSTQFYCKECHHAINIGISH
jgi:hypothetical protein